MNDSHPQKKLRLDKKTLRNLGVRSGVGTGAVSKSIVAQTMGASCGLNPTIKFSVDPTFKFSVDPTFQPGASG